MFYHIYAITHSEHRCVYISIIKRNGSICNPSNAFADVRSLINRALEQHVSGNCIEVYNYILENGLELSSKLWDISRIGIVSSFPEAFDIRHFSINQYKKSNYQVLNTGS